MNSKNKKILRILLLALVVSIMFGVGLYMYLTPQRTTMYVFNGNYKTGDAVTMDILTPVQVDSKIIYSGQTRDASTELVTGENINEVLRSGQSLRMDVIQGLPLTISLLSDSGGSSVEMKMDPKSVAVTVPVTETTGVTNDLQTGSRVNIYTLRNDAVVMILQNMRVLSVNRDDGGAITGATIECTKDQSLKLVYASSNSTIYFGMVSGSNYEPTEGEDPSYKPK